eukprot:GHVS01065033.1.p1 GENE.GHVS01065033.1~~GHVS01065033.1.p1  ORF type:complete len:916 (+),score=123.17 GHVS01065033.1:1521-4268(+)
MSCTTYRIMVSLVSWATGLIALCLSFSEGHAKDTLSEGGGIAGGRGGDSEMAEALKLTELINAVNKAASGETNGLLYDTATAGAMLDDSMGPNGPADFDFKWSDGHDFFPLGIVYTRIQAAIESTLPTDGSSCYESNALYSPGSVVAAVWHGVSGPSACQNWCRLVGDMCNYWTYVKNKLFPSSFGAACFLKTWKLPAQPAWQDNYMTAEVYDIVSGPKNCPNTNPIQEPIVSIAGCPSSPSMCQTMSLLPFGIKAVFEERCNSKSVDSNNCSAAVGQKCCTYCGQDDGFGHKCSDGCYTNNIYHGGGTVLRYEWNGIRSPGDCHTLCLTEELCTHFMFFQPTELLASMDYLSRQNNDEHDMKLLTTGGGCVLKEFSQFELATMDSSSLRRAVNPTREGVRTVFGPRRCPPPKLVDEPADIPDDDSDDWPVEELTTTTTKSTTPNDGCYKDNTDYFGKDLSKRQVGDAVLCKAACQAHDSCRFFSFTPWSDQGVNCFLKAVGADIKAMATNGMISGPRCCPRDSECQPASEDPCMVPDIDFFGCDIRSIGDVDSPEKCQYRCLHEPACLYWSSVYSDIGSVCHLKSSDIQRRTSGTDGYVSGRRVCPSTDFRGINSSGCLIPNIAYSGSKKKKILQQNLKEADDSSASQCQAECAKAAGDDAVKCKFFSYDHPKDGQGWTCTLLADYENIVYSPGSVSGHGDCRDVEEIPSSVDGLTYTSQALSSFAALATRPVNFTRPDLWKQIGITLKGENGCVITDEPHEANTAETCWQPTYFPMKLRLQMVLNPWGVLFSGWRRYSGYTSNVTPPDNYPVYKKGEASEFVVIDETFTIAAEYHGLHKKLLDKVPDHWPDDWTREAFSLGDIQVRLQLLTIPDEAVGKTLSVQVCLQEDDSTVGSCSYDITVVTTLGFVGSQ